MIVASIFRDAEPYVERYFDQIAALREHLPVTLWLAEGDSTDNTYPLLLNKLTESHGGDKHWHGDNLLQISHGGRKFPSCDNPERWNQIATVWNALLDKIPAEEPMILVEGDLIWDDAMMLALLSHIQIAGLDAVAPQSLKGDRFYDTWGYRWPNGSYFESQPLPSTGWIPPLVPISSAGSCIAMRPEVHRDCRFGENDGIVGFWRDAHFRGYSLYLDPSLKVEHP